MKIVKPNEIIIGPVRLSYLNVFEPRMNDQKGVEEYSATLLIPKSPTPQIADPMAELKAIRAYVETAMDDFFKPKPAIWVNPLKDGDKEKRTDNGESKNPGYGYINVSAKKAYPPKLIDGRKNEALAGDWNSGDWGYVKLSIFAFDQKGNKGVSFGLRGIQFVAKDEALGGAGKATDEGFDEIDTAPTANSAVDEYDPFAE